MSGFRKKDGAGYINRHAQKANAPPLDQPWCWVTLKLMESAAWQAMSLAARKALERLQREHMAHAGRENGRLKVTWSDFERAGVQRRTISETIAELETLGLAMRTFRGRSSHGEDPGAAAMFRLTWLPVIEPNDLRPATNEWKRYGDDLAAAKQSAKVAGQRTMALRSKRSIVKPSIPAYREDIYSSGNGGTREIGVLVVTGEPRTVVTGEPDTGINGGTREKTFNGLRPARTGSCTPVTSNEGVH
jgi:hypothetical protein